MVKCFSQHEKQKYRIVVTALILCLGKLLNTYAITRPARMAPTAGVLVGFADMASGIGRLPIVFADMLHKDIPLTWISTDDRYIKSNRQDIPNHLRPLFRKSCFRPAKVALFTDMLWDMLRKPAQIINHVKADIKIAYSMLESTAIPKEWAAILNTQFDAVVVPDIFLVDVYKKSGVTIPIFVIPIPLYLEDFLASNFRATNKQFVFANASALWPHKNHKVLIKAFAQAFGNSPHVKLKINGRMACPKIHQELTALIKSLGLSNVELSVQKLSDEQYKKFMFSSDCYVNPSTGEGFSIPPYEASAAGIPVIVTDNTAQASLCRANFVYGVKSTQKIPAYYTIFGRSCGYGFMCATADVAKALKEVYTRKNYYRERAQKGRVWVKKFLKSSLKTTYKALFNPTSVQLGRENSITSTGILITNNRKLYDKYKSIKNYPVSTRN